MGGDVISAGVEFPVEAHVLVHVSSRPLKVRPFFPKMLSCRLEHSPAGRVLHEKYARGHFLSRSASVTRGGYGLLCLPGCAKACKLGTIKAQQHATACVLLGAWMFIVSFLENLLCVSLRVC